MRWITIILNIFIGESVGLPQVSGSAFNAQQENKIVKQVEIPVLEEKKEIKVEKKIEKKEISNDISKKIEEL